MFINMHMKVAKQGEEKHCLQQKRNNTSKNEPWSECQSPTLMIQMIQMQGDLALEVLQHLGQEQLTFLKRTHIYRVPFSSKEMTPHLKQH